MQPDTLTHQKQREQRIAIDSIDRRIGLPVKYALIPLTLLAVWLFVPETFGRISFYAGFGLFVGGTVLLTILYKRTTPHFFLLVLLSVWIEELYLGVLAAHIGTLPFTQVIALMIFSAAPVLKAGLLSTTHRQYLIIASSASIVFLGTLALLDPIPLKFTHFWLAYPVSWGLIITGQFILDDLIKQQEERFIAQEQRGRLVRKLIHAQEEERKRIARELHDETSQSMAALMVQMEAAEIMLSRTCPESREVRAKLTETRALVSETMSAVHRIAFDLRPILLDDLGLIPAIREYARVYKEKVGIKITCNFNGLNQRLSPNLELILFRVIQEALTNVIKHARAKAVYISLALHKNIVTAVIQDDGQGFDMEQVLADEKQECLGINGMQERVGFAGGVFTLDSHVGDGTRIDIALPIH